MKTLKHIWVMLKPFVGIAVMGGKWYVKARYGVDVDEILKDRESHPKLPSI